ncbi:MAG: dTMP kinase [Treponema sp.]|jgi:dTMP kinase|nr:dTMP kinase [Treponema sp.]
MNVLRNFAVFEGLDGSGTSTQMKLLTRRFGLPGAALPPLYATAEPTDGETGILIRRALKGEPALLSETLARLFAADRGEHLYGTGGIAERAGRGELVVCDRYVPSSLVYQGLECGEELPRALNSPFPAPELILFFDLDPRAAAERIRNRKGRDIYERADFQIKVHSRYLSLLPFFRSQGSAVARIDAALGPEDVAEQVWAALRNMPIMRG